ncbi:MAG: hypothetical protein QNL07_00950 [Candidatus Planktophila sp.]|jgi:hypothetical protein|tara:strand:+ start:13704 stop:14036 length:333 start_codon:yes stop_codon:yes gene_type:complete
MPDQDENLKIQSVINRMKSEPPIILDFVKVGAPREPTLDEARSELANSVGQLAHMIFSKKYGPLVGTVTNTTIETVLKNGEDNLYRAKGDATLVIQELVDRLFTSPKRNN